MGRRTRPTRERRQPGPWPVVGITMALLQVASSHDAWVQSGELEQIREEVRIPGPAEPEEPPSRSRDDHDRDCRKESHDDREHDCHHGHCRKDETDGDSTAGAYLLAAAVTSPYWGPHGALGDDFNIPCSFSRFPYDGRPGYLIRHSGDWLAEDGAEGKGLLDWLPHERPWAVRWDMEYADTFDQLSRLGGHLLLSTQSRFDLDIGASRFEEVLSCGRTDHLWLGDANVVYRFAQNEYAQFRSGLGLNWLGDNGRADLGFNFTYGVDVFPVKPWIFTAAIDWGTLGNTGLFRFHTTAGILIRSIEAYTGYEYVDIGSIHSHSLLGGLRFWF